MKRVLSLFICIALLLTLQPLTARAVQTFTISEMGISLIKNHEGFRDVPYADSRGRWYVGYGTPCNPEDYPYPITEADADYLLRQALARKEEDVNEFLLDYSITVTQNQFDTLVSMTYTLGTQWINPTYRLCSYLINGIWNYSEAEIVNAIATWCHQGTTVLDGLADRRLQEAYLFLYGQYPNAGPDNYCYIHFDPAGGEVENQTVFYPKGSIYGMLPAPEGGSGTFQGWYTEDGTLLTGAEFALEDVTVTAVWDSSAEVPEKEEKPQIDLSTWVNPYGDVKETDWYYTYVRELSAKGIMGGYEDSTFRADRTLTAGEALKLILLAAGHPDPGNASPGHWAANYLALAERLGCVYPGEITNLDAPISRRSIANITAIAMGLQARYGASPFADSESGYLLTLYEEKILNGTISGGKRYYYPDNNIIRAEVCAIISRVSNWQYTPKNEPAQTGFIAYRDKFYPLQRNAAVAAYNPNLFVQDGSRMYYNDTAYRTAIGIDVSSYQGEIDWQKVAASGVEFAMIRLGFRGYGEEGTVNLDQYFLQNLQGAKAAGIKVGAYFFSQATNANEAVEEALFCLQNLQGYTLEYPMVYDWETIIGAAARTDGMNSTEVTDCALAFCQTIEQYGYTAMIYYNSDVAYAKYQQNRTMDYDVWFAQYAQWPTMYYNYRIWQYTDSGTVPGIDSPVDMNIAMIPY